MIEKELQNNPAFQNLCQAIAKLKTAKQAENFLRDIATFKELKDMGERLETARLINKGISYRKINEQTGISTATITRVAHWLHHGMGGYKWVLHPRSGK